MNKTSTTFFAAIDADREIQITLSTRFYNHIASDPRTITRPISATELLELVETIRRKGADALSQSQTVNYPEQ